MLVIDTHCHTGNYWAEPVETLLYQMQANGVAHAVLAQMNGHYGNSYIIECTKRYPEKFRAVVIVDPEDKARTKKLESLHKQGASGLRINLRKEWDANDPVFQVCGGLGMIVSVIGNAENFASARFKKLLDSFPDTQFCLEHLCRSPNAGMDFTEPPHDGYEASLECAKWPNTTVKVPGLGEIVKQPLPFPESQFPFAKIPPLYDMAKAAFGAHRMMWGSSFPSCAHKEGYRNALQWVLKYPGFQNGDDIEWIMGRSAAKLWGFPA